MSINSSTWVHIIIYMEIHGSRWSYMGIYWYYMRLYRNRWVYLTIINWPIKLFNIEIKKDFKNEVLSCKIISFILNSCLILNLMSNHWYLALNITMHFVVIKVSVLPIVSVCSINFSCWHLHSSIFKCSQQMTWWI